MQWLLEYIEVDCLLTQGCGQTARVGVEPKDAVVLLLPQLLVECPVHVDIHVGILILEVYYVEDGRVIVTDLEEQGQYPVIAGVVTIGHPG